MYKPRGLSYCAVLILAVAIAIAAALCLEMPPPAFDPRDPLRTLKWIAGVGDGAAESCAGKPIDWPMNVENMLRFDETYVLSLNDVATVNRGSEFRLKVFGQNKVHFEPPKVAIADWPDLQPGLKVRILGTIGSVRIEHLLVERCEPRKSAVHVHVQDLKVCPLR